MKRITLLIIILSLGLVLAACGGDPTPESVSLDFTGTVDLKFTPDTAAVPAGANVTVNLASEGLEHSWLLFDSNVDVTSADADDQALNGINSGVIDPGETGTFSFTAPDAGTYTYACTVPGHAAAGMVGTLTVSE